MSKGIENTVNNYKQQLNKDKELIQKIADDDLFSKQKSMVLDIIDIFNLVQSLLPNNPNLNNLNLSLVKIFKKNNISLIGVKKGDDFDPDLHIPANNDIDGSKSNLKVSSIVTDGFLFQDKKIKDAIVTLEVL